MLAMQAPGIMSPTAVSGEALREAWRLIRFLMSVLWPPPLQFPEMSDSEIVG